jgi:hypothetical protein
MKLMELGIKGGRKGGLRDLSLSLMLMLKRVVDKLEVKSQYNIENVGENIKTLE